MTDKENSKAMYNLSVTLSKISKAQFTSYTTAELEKILGAYTQLLKEALNEPSMVEISKGALQQMAMLAIGPLTRLIAERYRS